ncbi:cytochrome P450 [Annulohypoxylon truncatum]|uniref:cytochrome P450 n=1 Tax=Annulohypoxylon truncatum TaxID=327061 RepID=UPI002008AF73|nr:cytochrome P450 [Annulohypoxylon truncatum]KAI1206182.1 cytochrome P450 [Annulohypoxylon truncatum]
MDLIMCAGLTAVESLLVNHIPGQESRAVSGKISLALFCAQYFAVKFYRIFLYHRYFSPLRHLPGPTDNHFLFGQALNFLKAESPTTLYIKWMREHPDAPFIRYLTWGNTEVLVPVNLNAHREVLQFQCYSLEKPNWFLRIVKEVGGHGLILMERDEHKAHRKMLGGSFSLKNIRKLEPIFQEKARDLCRYFSQCIRENDNKTGTIDCTTTFSKAILDIMGSAILGVRLDYVKPGEEKAEKSNDLKEGCSFHEAYDIFFSPKGIGKVLLFANGFLPTRWLPFDANRKFLFAMDWLNDVLRGLIRDRYRQVSAATAAGKYESKDSKDLLTFVVEESLPGGIAEGIGETEFLGHLLEFMAAGHDTSANMLSWSLYILALNPDIQETLREELKELPADPSYNDLERLPYLEAFSKEVLRLYSPSTTYHRATSTNIVVEGVHIPAGVLVDLAPSVTLMNPSIWGDDVDNFDPTRWQRLTGEQLSPYAFSPFSNGPRICIGRQFALFEIKYILMEIVRNFRYVSVDNGFTIENPGFTLRPHGLRVRFEQLKK